MNGRYPSRYGGYSGRFSRSTLVPEKKFLDTTLASTAIGTSGTDMANATTGLIEIVRGTGENERNGSRVRIKSLHGKIRLIFGSTTTIALMTNQCRVIIGIDKQANGAAISNIGDVLEASNVESFRNIENIHRFVILYDKTFTYSSSGIGGGSTTLGFSPDQTKFLRINLNMNIPIYYDGATGDVSEIRSHNLFAYAVALRTGITMVNNWRIRYYG